MIRFSYVPTFSDFLLFNRYAVRPLSKKMLPGGIVFFLLFCLLTAQLFFSGAPFEWRRFLFSTPLLIPGVIAIFLQFIMPLLVKKRWESAKELREDKNYTIDETGIRVDAGTLGGFVEWQHVSEADVYKGLFLFKTYQSHFYFFPVSCVPDKPRLIEIAREKVKTSKSFNAA